MTILGWILYILLAAIIIFGGAVIASNVCSGDYIWVGCLIAIFPCIIVLMLMFWWFGNTESGKRALKSQESDFNGGVERTVEVYDVTGNLIKQYEGKFDVSYDNDRIIFDDEKGNRHVIYYPTGTVIIDGKE